MRFATLLALVFLALPAGARQARPIVELSSMAQRIARPGPAARQAHFRGAVPHAATTGASAAAPLQGPGVVQTNFMDASNVVWFVTAAPLPAGTEIYPSLFMPDNTEIQLDAWRLSQDVAAGSSFSLPNIRTFGPFWPQGFFTYWVGITINGKNMQAAADVPVNTTRLYSDLQYMFPHISGMSQTLSGGDVILTISGVFTGDPAYVLIEDKVAPATAAQVSPTAVTVNLSKVPGVDLGSFWDALVTVGETGWCDTAILRITPPKPGSYNQAPL